MIYPFCKGSAAPRPWLWVTSDYETQREEGNRHTALLLLLLQCHVWTRSRQAFYQVSPWHSLNSKDMLSLLCHCIHPPFTNGHQKAKNSLTYSDGCDKKQGIFRNSECPFTYNTCHISIPFTAGNSKKKFNFQIYFASESSKYVQSQQL